MNLADEIKRMIKLEIQSYENAKSKTMLCKVVSTDGFLVEVNLIDVNGNEIEGYSTVKNIPIMQGRNIQPCLKVGDIGIIIYFDANITNYIFDKQYTHYFYGEFKFFMPILALKEFASNAEDFLIKSNLNNSNVTINDTSITLSTKEQQQEQNQGSDDELISVINIDKENITAKTTNISETAKGTITLTSEKAYSLTTKDNITMTSDKDFSLTTKGNLTIKGNNPLEIGSNSGNLKACFDAVFEAMDALKSSAMVAGQATLTWMPTYDTSKQKAQSTIQNIVK